MNVLAGLAGLYSLLILVRVMLSWFGGGYYGRPVELLQRITEPYLRWWQRVFGLRLGYFDLSPIAAMAALSLAQTVFSAIARYGSIRIGVILAITLSSIWSAASFLLGFCIVILALRLAAYLFNRDTYSGFWRVIDGISQPLLYRINRIIFGRRQVNYLTGIIVPIAALAAIWAAGGFAVGLLARLLIRLPV
jgi:YggT family protein